MTSHSGNPSRVAIIGMSLRFPGADSPDEFWRNLVEGRESIDELDRDRLREEGVSESYLSSPDYVLRKPMIGDISHFDASYFGLTRLQAQIMDPQHRIFLEVCEAALQTANIGDRARVPIGVFGGAAPNRYIEKVYRDVDLVESAGLMAIEIANQPDYLATRVSHVLGLRGPSLSVQTACSTALVAVHLAVRAIVNGECDVALAGGISVEMPYWTGVDWTPDSIFSKTGRCRAFDAAADGTIFGAGAGVVVLKSLERAIADGDRIRAVISASMTNNDAADRNGFTSPGGPGQVDLLMRLFDNSGIDRASIGYVESHGTGTAVGDPIEFASLTEAFTSVWDDDPQWGCPIGSVKTNIGHLGAAAGIAGLIKAVLALENDYIPPTLHFEKPSEAIDWVNSPFRVCAVGEEWAGRERRRALVSSFGIGGTNAAVVVDKADPAWWTSSRSESDTDTDTDGLTLVPIAGPTQGAVARFAAEIADHLDAHPDTSLVSVAKTLATGRPHGRFRRAILAGGRREAVDALRALGEADAIRAVDDARYVAMFPGQGSQFPGMAAALARESVAFSDALEEALDALRVAGADVRAAVLDPASDPDALMATEVAQPALFAVEYALARAWIAAAGDPVAVLGHSIGEFAAACIAGVFTLEDAAGAVVQRGRLMQAMAPGAMAAITGETKLVSDMLPAELAVAARNSPSSTVVSGPEDAVERFMRRATLLGMKATRLKTSHAFHSPMMREARDRFAEHLRAAPLSIPRIPVVSTQTGLELTNEQAVDASFWADQILAPVEFMKAVRRAVSFSGSFVEIGPGTALTVLARQSQRGGITRVDSTPLLPRGDEGEADSRSYLSAIAALWTRGHAIDWTQVFPAESPRTDVPVYPFERVSHWFDREAVARSRDQDDDDGDIQSVDRSVYEPTWRRRELVTESGETPARWLLFGDGRSLGALPDHLEARGADVRVVDVSAAVAGAGSIDETIRVQVERIEDSGFVPEAVVFASSERTGNGLDTDFFAPLALVTALVRLWPDEPIAVAAVTSGALDVSGADPLDPLRALQLGPFTVVPREMPLLSGALIDVAGRGIDARTARAIEGEFAAGLPTSVVALRGSARWVRDFTRVPLPAKDTQPPAVLADGGVFVITGGTGGIGLAVAAYLAEWPGLRVALLARRGPAALGYQDTRLQVPDARSSGALLNPALRRMAAEGRLLALRCDVVDAESVASAVADVRSEWGPITAVVHAAGAIASGLAVDRTADVSRGVLEPKVRGADNILAAVEGEAALVMLFASIVGVTSDPGNVDYCSGNAYLDALARHRDGATTRVVAIDWCGWTDVGMLRATTSRPAAAATPLGTRHPILEAVTRSDDAVTVTGRMLPETSGRLDDHRMFGVRVLSSTTVLDLILTAAGEAAGGPVEVCDVFFGSPVRVEAPTDVRIVGTDDLDGEGMSWHAQFRTSDAVPWETHGVARSRTLAPAHDAAPAWARAQELETRAARLVDYDAMTAVEIRDRWREVDAVHDGVHEQLVRVGSGGAAADGWSADPVSMDNALTLGLTITEDSPDGTAWLPAGIDAVRVYGRLEGELLSYIRRVDLDDRSSLTFDVTVFDRGGLLLASATGMRLRQVPVDAAATPEASTAASTDIAVNGDLSDYFVRPEEGIRLFDAILRLQGGDRYVISRIAPGHLLDASTLQRRRSTDAFDIAAEHELDVDPTVLRLMRMMADALGNPRLDADEDFFDAGGNSLVAVQLLSRVRAEFAVTIPGTALIDCPTPRSLAGLVERLRPAA
ncbi:type I polyketide synthase [Microbacterium sp. SLBN-146]|uniref:type I polyketide synthase n=1 Tax=Microbacterium sp. SLBN-146 TaxID=2768457 RepID=UPI0011519D5A|nr:type I polyketide synthase [Microbacterium sp. SLBN-146]TQJ31120.1 acyl transferase domain-containing protein [Microbacterium sp. SLBN-146]